ncbi:hypothetical protein, partial [Micromonospora sp. XM-20-01]|uniref:hypothetical protein n=1 Tax=Micromonospora sp. XM-20-01 TaxID=2583240 RepID=UPI002030AFE6
MAVYQLSRLLGTAHAGTHLIEPDSLRNAWNMRSVTTIPRVVIVDRRPLLRASRKIAWYKYQAGLEKFPRTVPEDEQG